MDLTTVLSLVDSSTAVVALLFVGWQVKTVLDNVLSNQQDIIKQLIDLCGNDDD